MTNYVAIYSIIYSGANWILFCILLWHKPDASSTGGGQMRVELQGLDPEKVIEAGGRLARAFKSAGGPATAAAMSVIGLIIAAVAAGLGKL